MGVAYAIWIFYCIKMSVGKKLHVEFVNVGILTEINKNQFVG